MKNAGELFDEHASTYDRSLGIALAPSGESREYFALGRVAWLERCTQELHRRPSSILDFGCGDGTTTPLLLKALKAHSAIGIDVSAKSIELARANNTSESVGYETIVQFQPIGEMDLAYCNGVFHHIAPESRSAALGVVHRALVKGGLLSLWENNPWSLATRYVMSRCAFDRDAVTLTPPEARSLVRAGGFEVVRTDFRFIFPHTLRALRRIEDWAYRLPLGTQYQILCRKI